MRAIAVLLLLGLCAPPLLAEEETPKQPEALVFNSLDGSLLGHRTIPPLAERWITRRGYALTILLIFIWPILSIPAQVFSQSYFAFWVLVSIAWGFGAALVITIKPLTESSEEINTVLSGLFNWVFCRTPVQAKDPNAKVLEDDDTPEKVDVDVEEIMEDNRSDGPGKEVEA